MAKCKVSECVMEIFLKSADGACDQLIKATWPFQNKSYRVILCPISLLGYILTFVVQYFGDDLSVAVLNVNPENSKHVLGEIRDSESEWSKSSSAGSCS